MGIGDVRNGRTVFGITHDGRGLAARAALFAAIAALLLAGCVEPGEQKRSAPIPDSGSNPGSYSEPSGGPGVPPAPPLGPAPSGEPVSAPGGGPVSTTGRGSTPQTKQTLRLDPPTVVQFTSGRDPIIWSCAVTTDGTSATLTVAPYRDPQGNNLGRWTGTLQWPAPPAQLALGQSFALPITGSAFLGAAGAQGHQGALVATVEEGDLFESSAPRPPTSAFAAPSRSENATWNFTVPDIAAVRSAIRFRINLSAVAPDPVCSGAYVDFVWKWK